MLGHMHSPRGKDTRHVRASAVCSTSTGLGMGSPWPWASRAPITPALTREDVLCGPPRGMRAPGEPGRGNHRTGRLCWREQGEDVPKMNVKSNEGTGRR